MELFLDHFNLKFALIQYKFFLYWRCFYVLMKIFRTLLSKYTYSKSETEYFLGGSMLSMLKKYIIFYLFISLKFNTLKSDIFRTTIDWNTIKSSNVRITNGIESHCSVSFFNLLVFEQLLNRNNCIILVRWIKENWNWIIYYK